MTPDMKRLCEKAQQKFWDHNEWQQDLHDSCAEAIVRAVLMELREPSSFMLTAALLAEPEDFEHQLKNMINQLLAEPATA